MTKIVLGPEIKAGSFNFYSDGSTRHPVAYIYPVDIDGDGIDEIFFAGFETQPNTPAEYSNTSIHIFGWLNGVLQEITNKWLPNNAHKVEGVGDIAFGDFNGDGKLDVYLSANTDMEHAVNAYELINKGNYFEKNNLGTNVWEHGVAAFDINNDGFTDVVPVGYSNPGYIYYGSSTGLKRTILKDSFGNNSWDTNGSGVAIGDFFGNGTASMVVVDAAAHSGKTILVAFDSSNPEILTYKSTLPDPILDDLKYGTPRDSLGNSHDVRARGLDFNKDGLLDVLIFSRMSWNGNEWPEVSAVQFLKNLGNGVFEDVTETTLIGYKNDTNISYNPIIADFNKDGLDDIYLSESAFSSVYDSTAILLQKSNGTFVETARTELSQYVPNYGGISTIAKGPDGNYYMIVMSNLTSNNAGIKSISSYEMSFWDIYGTANNDLLVNLPGNDQINGGAGIDTLVVSGLPSQYSFSANTPSGVDGTLTGVDGIDTLTSIEFIRFGASLGNDLFVSDLMPSQLVDPDGNGPRLSPVNELIKSFSVLYIAYFNRSPDIEGLMYWFKELNSGNMTLSQVSSSFTQQPEYSAAYPAGSSNREFIAQIYQNLFDRTPDTEGWNYWENELNNGSPRDVFILTVINGAYAPTGGASDRALLNNKNAVSLHYTEQLSSFPTEAFDLGISTVLNRVTNNPATVNQGLAVIDHVMDNPITLTGLISDAQAFNAFW